jgi:hypothetical protein
MPTTSLKKTQRSINTSRGTDNFAVDIVNEKDSPFESVSDFYDTGGKLLWLLSKGNSLERLASAVREQPT